MSMFYKNVKVIGVYVQNLTKHRSTGQLCGEMGLFLLLKLVVRKITLRIQVDNVRK
jgi:hypothetical protein